MPTVTDPRVVRFLESRGFHPDPIPNQYHRDALEFGIFRRRMHDVDGTVHDIRIHCSYGWGKEEHKIPTKIAVYTDDVKYRLSVRVQGQNKWIVQFDDAIAASVALAKLNTKQTKEDAKKKKVLALQILNGDFFANAHNPNNPGHPPAP